MTLRTWLTNAGLDAIAAEGGPLREALVAAVRHWTPIMYRLFGGGEAIGPKANVAFLHDPLALASVFDESFCTFEDLPIEAAMHDGLFRTFERDDGSADARTVRCAVDVDAPRFHEFLRRTTTIALILDMERTISLEGCFNFRDLGGYPTSDGSIVRWRHLYRSDGLQHLTDGDVAVLCDELSLGEIIDLRSSNELRADGRGLLEETSGSISPLAVVRRSYRSTERRL